MTQKLTTLVAGEENTHALVVDHRAVAGDLFPQASPVYVKLQNPANNSWKAQLLVPETM